MKPQEVRTPVIADDFEPGDRIYYVINGATQKGTVKKISGLSKADHIAVELDAHIDVTISLRKFGGKSQAVRSYGGKEDDYCGFIPNLDRLKKGTVISRLQDDGTRIYALVMLHEPGNRLLINRTDKWDVYDYRTINGTIFEDKLFDWEIEG